MYFLLCETDESVFDTYIIGTFPVVGTHKKFVIPAEFFYNSDELITSEEEDRLEEELAELGITMLMVF